MTERTTYTHEAQIDALVDYLAQNNFHETTLKIDVDNELKPIFDSDQENFPTIVREALYRLLSDHEKSLYPELSKDELQHKVWELVYSYHVILETKNIKKIQNIKLNLLPQTFDVMILGVDWREGYNRKPLLVCDKGCSFYVETGADHEPPKIEKCSEHEQILRIDPTRSIHDFIQRVVIQEQLTDAKNMSPIDYDARIFGDMVGDTFSGQRKRIMAVPRLLSKNGKIQSVEQKLLFDIISMADLGEEKQLLPSNIQIEEYRTQAVNPDWFDKVIGSFAPHLIGNELVNVKKGLFLALIGATDVENGRSELNVFMGGDPSVAKSSLLKECQAISQKSMYTSGRGSSAAGLTIGMVKRPDGTMLPQAGVLPLCNGGVALIDELDKMNAEDRSALHEAMEQRSVSIAKAGNSITLPAKTAIIGAANPKMGKWQESLSIMENIDLPPPLVSRFDLKFRILDIPDEIADAKKAARVLAKFKGEQTTLFTRQQLLALINHARTLKPQLSENASTMLQKYYVMLRKKDTKDLVIDVRSLEALSRIAIAHARLHFKDFVDTQDVNAAIELYKASLTSFGIDLDSEGEQTKLFVDRREVNKHETFWEVFNKCKDENGTVAKPDVLEMLGESKLFTRESARKFFDDMCRGTNQQLLEDVRGRFRRIE